MPEKQTHYLVPQPMSEALDALVLRTRVDRSHHFRDAVAVLLHRYADRPVPTDWPAMPHGASVSEVLRLPDAHLTGLRALAARTQIRRSVWFRRGLAEYLAENEVAEVAGEPREHRALDDAAAARIREALAMGYSAESQALVYGVAPTTVKRIRDGLTYKAGGQ